MSLAFLNNGIAIVRQECQLDMMRRVVVLVIVIIIVRPGGAVIEARSRALCVFVIVIACHKAMLEKIVNGVQPTHL